MVTVGPACISVLTSSEAPTITARMGTTHTGDSRQGLFFSTTGSGSGAGADGGGASGVSAMGAPVVPDQAWIEAARGQHGEHDHRRESEQPRLGLHVGEAAELHDAAEQH